MSSLKSHNHTLVLGVGGGGGWVDGLAKSLRARTGRELGLKLRNLSIRTLLMAPLIVFMIDVFLQEILIA